VIRRVRISGSGVTVDTVAGENDLIEDKDERAETKSTRRGLQGFGNGVGAVARFRGPDGMALASNGILYVADATNQYIRAVDTTSATFDVTTASGIGIVGFTDGAVSTARYSFPLDVALTPDESGLVVADFGNNRIRLFDIVTGSVSTIAGSGFEGTASGGPLVAQFRGPIGVTVGSDGTVYVTDNASNTIRKVSPEGNTTTLAGGGSRSKFKDGIGPDANFKDPRGILFDPSIGSVVVSDQGHQRLRKIVP
jgi:DNA-binding beta-propeller fold protein YncE